MSFPTFLFNKKKIIKLQNIPPMVYFMKLWCNTVVSVHPEKVLSSEIVLIITNIPKINPKQNNDQKQTIQDLNMLLILWWAAVVYISLYISIYLAIIQNLALWFHYEYIELSNSNTIILQSISSVQKNREEKMLHFCIFLCVFFAVCVLFFKF